MILLIGVNLLVVFQNRLINAELRRTHTLNNILKNKLELSKYTIRHHLNNQINFVEKNIIMRLDHFFNSDDYDDFNSKSKPLLILKISENNCNTCIDSVLSISNSFFRNHPKDVVIFTDYYSERDYNFFTKSHDIHCNIFNLKAELDLSINNKATPFYFILDSLGLITDLHIPLKENNSYTADYLKLIEEKYFVEEN